MSGNVMVSFTLDGGPQLTPDDTYEIFACCHKRSKSVKQHARAAITLGCHAFYSFHNAQVYLDILSSSESGIFDDVTVTSAILRDMLILMINFLSFLVKWKPFSTKLSA